MSKIIPVVLLILFMSGNAFAQYGTLDCSFGNNGLANLNLSASSNTAQAIAVFKNGTAMDGKIAVAGNYYDGTNSQFGIAIFNEDGTPYTTFNGTGWNWTSFNASYKSQPYGIAIQSNDKIVVAGIGHNQDGGMINTDQLAMARFNTNGTLDATFGSSGKVFISLGPTNNREDEMYDMVIDASNNIYVAGGKWTDANTFQRASVIYKTDPNGNNGQQFVCDVIPTSSAFGTPAIYEAFYGLTIQGGNVYAVGYYEMTENGDKAWSVAKMSTSGVKDNSFGTNGIAIINPTVGQADRAYDVGVQSDGTVVVMGVANNDFAVVKLNAAGVVQNTYKFEINGTDDCTGGLVLSDDKILLYGNNNSNLAFIRLNADGTLDNTFGNSGKIIVDHQSRTDYVYDAAIQSDGKMVSAGSWSNPAGTTEFAVTRLIIEDLAMTYCYGEVVQQQTGEIFKGDEGEILKIKISVTGNLTPESVTQMNFTTVGSTNATTDIASAELYYTGISDTYAQTTQFGSSVNNPNGSFTFNGSQSLSPGTNYFWLVYTIKSTATSTNLVDAVCTNYTLSSGTYVPTNNNPTGNRKVVDLHYPYITPYNTVDNAYNWITNVTFGTINNSTGKSTDANNNQDGYSDYSATQSTNVTAENTYNLSVTINVPDSWGEYVRAYFDWNSDYDFSDIGEEIIIESGNLTSGTVTVNKDIPIPAGVSGAVRLRVICDYSESVNGGGSIYGEAEDYTINVVATNSAPTVTTQAVSSIVSTTATGNGNVTATGGANVTERGIYYSTTDGFANGTGTKVSTIGNWSTTGAFIQAITGLTANTTYYVKAFAKNSAGTSYGAQVSFTTSAASNTVYVDASKASDSGDGLSWANAKKTLQAALDIAVSGKEIWVKAGTYKPTFDYGTGSGSNPSLFHFRMKNGVAIYGGFAGTETAVSQRTNFGVGQTNETILSGDVGTVGDNSDNCWHIFFHPNGTNLNNSAILDGFTITKANANKSGTTFVYETSGGGMYNEASSPVIRNTSFINNAVVSFGGAMYNLESSPVLDNVVISNNIANVQGGGICNSGSNLTMTNSVISDNTSGLYGGGLIQEQSITLRTNSTSTFTNVIIKNNSATEYGGGIENLEGCTIVFTNVTIANNSSAIGGGYDAYKATATFNNCILWGNTATTSGHQISLDGDCPTTLNYSCYSNGISDVFGGIPTTNNSTTSDPKFVNPSGNDFRIYGNSPCVNTGNNSCNSQSYDIRRQARIQNTTIDMGGYEWTSGVDPTLATITTNAVSSISGTGALMGGNIASDGLSSVTERGVVYSSTNATPTIGGAGVTKASNGIGTGNFSATISSLTSATLYYIQAYAINSAGTSYGGVQSLTTTSSTPTVTTQAVSNIASTTATGNGTVTATGGANITERGVYWSTTDGFADGAGTKVSTTGDWSTTGAFTQAITGLTANTTYYVKAFAKNSAGTSYGAQVSFTTLIPEINIQGNSVSIVDGDLTPSAADHTDFGSQSACSGTIVRTFTIQNTGTGNLTLSNPTISGTNAADFSVTANPASPVSASGSTTFQVTFNPSATGIRTATISISNDDSNENPYDFSIQGTGTDPEVNLQGNSTSIADGDATPSATDHTDFGSQSVCSGTIVRTFTIQNTGTSNLTLANPIVSGLNAADFSVTANPVSPVSASGSTTFQVTFNPSANGTRSANITFTNNDCDEATFDFAIQGIGTDPEVDVQGNSTSIADGDITPTTADNTDFGSQSVCSGTIVRTFTIQNTGKSNLTLANPTISGTNAADFSVTANPVSPVSASGSTTFQITFNPSAIGTRSAIITFTNNDCNEATYDFAIQGTGTDPEINVQGNSTSIADGDATPSATDHTDFGSVAVGSGTIVRTYTIQNTGTSVLTLGSNAVSVSGDANFTVTAQPATTVAAGGSTTFQVTFDPTTSGVHSASISIINDDCDENLYNFSIQGTGIPPIVSSVSVPSNGTYRTGDNLDFTVNYTEAITVNTSGGTPYIPITLNTGGTVNAAYVSGSGTPALVFRYTVASGNLDPDGVLVGALTANGGTLKNAGGTDANLTLNSVGSTANIKVDAVAPVISSVSSATDNGIYKLGDVISVTVAFDEAVTVTGTPTLSLNSGGTASYSLGSGTATLTFSYTVGSGQSSADLDYSATNSLSLNGGTIKDGPGNDALLTLPSVGEPSSLGGQKNIVVGNLPTVTTQAVSSIAPTTATGNGSILALGTSNPTAYGICWNTSGNPTTSDSKVDNGAALATGAFTALMSGLAANTTYYVRAFATNTIGTSYGEQQTFTTLAPAPTITSTPTLTAPYGKPYSYSIVATMEGELETTLTAPTKPAWLSFSSDGQNQATLFGNIPAGKQISGVAGDNDGNIYAITYNGTEIYKIGADGTTTLWKSGLIPGSVYALHISNGYIYIPRHSNFVQSITRIPLSDPSAAEETFATLSGGALSLTDKDGWIYAANFSARQIFRVNETTKENQLILSSSNGVPGSGPFGLTFGDDGNLYIATWNNWSIIRYDGASLLSGSPGVPTTVVSGLPSSVSSIRQDKNGNFYLSMSGGGVRKYTSDFSSFQVVSLNATDNIWSLSFTTSGALVYSKMNTNEIYRLQTGAILTGTPAKTDLGDHAVVVRANNATGYTEQSFTIKVIDNVGPVISAKTPASSATNVALQPTLSLTFDEEVSLGDAGTLTLYNGATLLKSFDLSLPAEKAQLVLSEDKLSLSVALTENLPVNTAVTVGVSAGFVKDIYNNNFIGFTAASDTWRFTTINKNEQTITFPAIAAKTYGDATFTLGDAKTNRDLTVTYTAEDPTVVSITGNQATILKTGSTKITATQAGDGLNFAATPIENTLTVNKAELTVTADNQTKVYGDDNPTLTFKYNGWKNTDDESVLDTKPTISTTVDLKTSVGYHANAITVSGGNDNNYSFNYIASDFEVTKAALAIIAEALDKIYDGNNSATVTGGQLVGILNNDFIELTLGSATFDNKLVGTNKAVTVAGSTISGTAAGNYSLTEVTGLTANITPKQLTITNTSVVKNKMFDNNTSALVESIGTLEGVVSDDLNAINVSLVANYNDAIAGNNKTITAVFTISGSAASNYIKPVDLIITGAKISEKVSMAETMEVPVTGECQGGDLFVGYKILKGEPTEYRIIFDAAALAAGFADTGYLPLPSAQSQDKLYINIPENMVEGVYVAKLQFRNELNDESPVYPFEFSIKLSKDYLVKKFDDVILCDNSSNRFTTYQWYKNGQPIPGATSQFYNDLTGLDGFYSLQVGTKDGAVLWSCEQEFHSPINKKAIISAYPNPARSSEPFTVKVTNLTDQDLKGAVMRIYSIQGSLIQTLYEVKQINSVKLPFGEYIGTVITTDQKRYTYKILVVNL